MLSITIEELRQHHACDLPERIAGLTAHLGRTPADDEPIPLATWAAVAWTARDGTHHPEHSATGLIWALRCCWDRGGRAVGVEVACRAAERAIGRIPEERRAVARAAIDAARGCVAGAVTREECRRAARAAYAAYAAALAAYAAAADAAAADAAAAYAAADAYVADAAGAHAAERDHQRADFLALITGAPS